jgi:hypothetical protein
MPKGYPVTKSQREEIFYRRSRLNESYLDIHGHVTSLGRVQDGALVPPHLELSLSHVKKMCRLIDRNDVDELTHFLSGAISRPKNQLVSNDKDLRQRYLIEMVRANNQA